MVSPESLQEAELVAVDITERNCSEASLPTNVEPVGAKANQLADGVIG